MSFTHLHVHTEYSLLDGSCKIKELITKAKELNMEAIAITDHGVMYGVIDFYKAAKEAGIKPILGCEVYVSPGSRFDREAVQGEDRYYHLVLLAENDKGFENLTKIVSIGFSDGFYYRPRVDYETLEKYHEGIIALSACLAGEVPKLIMRGEYEKAREVALKNKNLFGENNYFLELQDHGIYEQKKVNEELIKISKELDIGLVATNDVHYINKEDAAPHDVLLCIQTAKKLSDENRMRYEWQQFYLKPEEVMKRTFSHVDEALENTKKIADRCNVDIEFAVTKLPEYEVPDDLSAPDYLKKLCYKGLEYRYDKIDAELKERMEYELSVIENMGYVDYFLIVWDYINYAKQNNIAVGPGRGSAAGSLVAYCLGITDIDPIKYQLIFERFLNPERISMPDIDVDFCFERRGEVIDYVVRKYGKERVCQIITFGTLAARGVIRDVGRVMDIPYSTCDEIAKLVPTEIGMTLTKALNQSKELKSEYENKPEIKNLIDLSLKLEGLPRHSSVHAAGVVISKKSVDEYVPIAKAADGSLTTQYTMGTLEELGLLKMDFLGLRTLTVIQKTLDQIKQNYNKEIDILKIDYEDKNVFDLIGTGKTEGIFQLESAGMASFMKELKPESLEDIIAGISLYRPGPMEFIPKYLKGKNEKATITYLCKELEPILEPTYGCIVYQEQVMQIVRDLAGYTLGRSDLVRRAMSKKKSSVMEKERRNFVYGNEEEGVKGCLAGGIPENIANKIFDEMIDFAKYAFNKSHAACYAFVSYQTAFLKYYYPKEFMAALLTSVMDNTNKAAEYIVHARQMGINILPPDINAGESDFSVDFDAIRVGISAIKGVGKASAKEIVYERKENGKFKDFDEFTGRMSNKEVNKRTLENFIKSGALDSLPGNRKQKWIILPDLLDKRAKGSKAIAGQMSLFEIDTAIDSGFVTTMPDVEEFTHQEILAFEKETLGVYISGHPLDEDIDFLSTHTTAKCSDFSDFENEDNILKDKSVVRVGGMVTSISIKSTKRLETMAFITLEDMFGSVEVVIFPKVYNKYRDILKYDAKLLIEGKVNADAGGASKLLADKILEFGGDKNIAIDNKQELWIQYKDMDEYNLDFENLLLDLGDYSGDVTVMIYLRAEKKMRSLGDKWKVKADKKLIDRLNERMGEDNVKLVSKPIENNK